MAVSMRMPLNEAKSLQDLKILHFFHNLLAFLFSCVCLRSDAGFPDSASTHSMIAGIWSSFSGAGRFVSRAGTGILVDHIGFQMTAVVIFTVQIIVVGTWNTGYCLLV